MTLDQLEAGVSDMNGVRADDSIPDAVAADAASMPDGEVRRAEPAVPTKGVHWDLQPIKQIASLYAAGNTEEANRMRDEYRNASPVNAYVYDNLRGKSRVTAQYAAGLADSYRQMQDRIAMQQQSPQAQASQRVQQKEDKLARETMVRQQQVLEKIDRYTNPENPNYVDIADLVGPWDGTGGGMIDATIGSKEKATMRAELERLVNNDVLELTKFLRPISQDELKFLKTMTPRMYQNENIWRSYLQDTKQRLMSDAVRPAQAQPNLYQQSQQNPATQLRKQFEQSDELTLPNGQKLKRVVDANGNIGWEPQ